MRHLIKIVIVLLVISWAWGYGRKTFDRWVERPMWVNHSVADPVGAVPFFGSPSGEHFSPAENLERLDYAAVRSARRSLDISMYAFTDRLLAEAVVGAARRGVQVRIYRDGEQYEEEQERAFRYGSTTDIFRGQANIRIRVKPPSRWLLMHLKGVSADRSLLRTGSANWSPGGEKREDDDADYVRDPRAVERFERNFEVLWNRQGNLIIQ